MRESFIFRARALSKSPRLRQIQESNLKLARDLSVKAQAINRAGVGAFYRIPSWRELNSSLLSAIAAMETYGKQQLLRNDALNKLQEGIRQSTLELPFAQQVLIT